MVNDENLNTALLSIYPRFADSILSGEKRVEFRKTKMARNINRVVIYSTAPVQRVVGYFEVKEIVSKKPLALWRDYKNYSGLGYDEFLEYFSGKEEAVGIVVGEVVKLEKPLTLNEIGLRGAPPQSYRYLNWDEFGDRFKSDGFGFFRRFAVTINRAFQF